MSQRFIIKDLTLEPKAVLVKKHFLHGNIITRSIPIPYMSALPHPNPAP